MTLHTPSRDVTHSLTWRHTLPHVTSHTPSRDVTHSLTWRYTLPHVTSHTPSRDVTYSLMWRYTLPHVTLHTPLSFPYLEFRSPSHNKVSVFLPCQIGLSRNPVQNLALLLPVWYWLMSNTNEVYKCIGNFRSFHNFKFVFLKVHHFNTSELTVTLDIHWSDSAARLKRTLRVTVKAEISFLAFRNVFVFPSCPIFPDHRSVSKWDAVRATVRLGVFVECSSGTAILR